MRKRINFIRLIQMWGIIFLVGLGVSNIAIDVIGSYRDFNFRVDKMREDYIARQKQIIKQEVDRVVDMIRYEKAQSESVTKGKIKSRVYEAYSIAQHIYKQNKSAKNKHEIQQMILDALRPIRFEHGKGYYFATRLDGVERLFADKPQMEGLNLLDVQDTLGKFVVKDMIEIANQPGEGFYEYHWTKPDSEGNDFKKISFIKRFEPYDWLIGTGLYVDDVEGQIKAKLLSTISRIRFGKEGYIFVNRLNGDALVSNGKLVSGTKKLWEVFNKNPGKTKDLFEKEYHAALKPEGDYIYYSLIKLTNPNKESPKTSFIHGIPELQWLVGAGVYLDDVETDIALIQTELNNQIKVKMLYYMLIIIGIFATFYLFYNWLNQRLKKDFHLFISFFNRATHSDEKIDRENIKFVELDQMAECANKMLMDRKKTEEALRESEAQYRLLADNVSDAIWTMDMEQRFTFFSPSIQKLLGYTPEEALQIPLENILTPESYEKAVSVIMEEIAREGKPGVSPDRSRILELELIRKDGGTVWAELTASFVRDEKGLPSGLIGITRDITERKQAEKEQTLLSTAIEQASESIIVSDGRGTIQYINPSFEQLSGFDREDLIGQNFRILKCDKHDEAFYREMYDHISKGKIWIGHIANTMKDGTLCEFETRISPVHDSSGEIINYVSVNRDVTQEVALEAQLRQSQKMEAIGTLAGGVAHDFNNLLTVILGNAQLVLMRIDKDNPLNEYIEEIKNAGNNAALLTRQLLTFSRKQIIQPKVLSLSKVMDNMEKMLRRLIREDIELVLDLDSELWPVNIDPGQIEQIMMNLVVNAGDAMPGGGKLLIETANVHLDSAYFRKHGVDNMPGAYAMVAVTDNGIGMDEETRDRIFEPFFTTKELGHGTGLGLSTVYGIMKQHNGYVWIYSEPGEGTTFKVYFPKAVAEEVSDTEEQVADGLVQGSETILVVEDSKTLLKMTQKMLEKYGYRILTAQNGREALEVFSGHDGPIHLILTDVVMPEMNGRDLAEKIQTEKPEVKVIYMSGYTNHAISDKGMLYKEVEFIQKPFSPGALALKVREVLEN